jgi:presenilin-like A22 family membrane protease
MLVATGLMLLAIRYGGVSQLRLFIIFASVYISFFAFDVLVTSVLSAGRGATAVALGAALALGVVLYVYPEWYVVDAAGVVMGVGAAGLFGINFGVLPAIVLLSVLAVYDAISVYGTEHMLTLASGVMEMRVPVVLVVPLSLSYSFLDAEKPASVQSEGEVESNADSADPDGEPPEDGQDGDTELTAKRLAAMIETLDPERAAGVGPDVLDAVDEQTREALSAATPDRDALFIGLGDAVIPTVLVASAAFFVDTGPTLELAGVSTTLPAVTAMGGTLVGLSVLLWLVARGRAHAGLPLLNGGAIGGYLLGALASGLTLAEALGLTGVL